jgi:acyl carrier protein
MPHTPNNTLPKLTGPEILAKLTAILVELLHVDPAEVIPAAHFMPRTVPAGSASIPHLGADSLDHLEIIMATETEFGISIPDENAEELLTVQHTIDYLLTRKVF